MPRSFFQTFDGSAHPDAKGTELPGLEEAREETSQTTGEIIQSEGMNAWKGTDWHMEVTDAAGQALFTLRFASEA